MKLDYDFKQYDLRLLFLMIILNTVGIFIVRSAISAESFKDPLVVRQILGSFVGLSMCIGISLFDYRFVNFPLIFMRLPSCCLPVSVFMEPLQAMELCVG